MSSLSTRASNDQTRASDPTASAWVSANAGSGKTHVLVNRVIRLMLTGTPPEKILCLTFTIAAAAEMSNRLYERLAEWIPLDDEALINKIHENTGHIRFTKDQLAEPRRLFARALETPGGLKIQTIHAFCGQLLHRFPIEAGITSGFKVMDDRQTKELIARVRLDFFEQIERSLRGTSRNYVDEVIKFSGGLKAFDDLLEKLLNDRDKLRVVYQDLPAASNRLADALQIDPDDTAGKIISQFCSQLNREMLVHAEHVMQAQTQVTDKKQAAIIHSLLTCDSDATIFEQMQVLLLKKNLEQKSDTTLCSANCGANNPDILANLQAEAQRLIEALDKVKAVSILKATNAALHIGQDITEKYAAEKNLLGLYDYNDLIAKVLTMFAELPSAAWVLYKLDGGLDHILVDEAQDTSPAQWAIIQFLADDFFTGAGARSNVERSIFAVGDRKQSIYSFQGAAPESFDLQARHFQQIVEQSGQKFEPVNFIVSFRSTAQVLNLVDEVFAQDIAARGVEKTVHSANRNLEPGLVELWPLEEKTEHTKSSLWIPENNAAPAHHPRVRLAQKIARKIKSWLETGEILASEGRPIRPEDILILVRRRTQFMNALVRALKLLDIPVAGVDRLKLTSHIGVQDLLGLARFVLLPEDDLNFAGLLKSSLLEKDDGTPFDDDDLITIAGRRGEQSVWASFQATLKTGAPYTLASSCLENWLLSFKKRLPFEFFSSVLSAEGKRTSMLRRLGSEAGEPLDAFLAMTEDFEQNNVASLQGFLHWVEAGDTEIKRQMEKSRSEVRIMTIHGAKGLEAKIVILPDTFDIPDQKHTPPFLNCDNGTPVWRLKAAFKTPLTRLLSEQYLDETKEEYNRLLYVAMTRARDRLYIGAAQSTKNTSSESWYKLISNVLEKPEHEVPDDIFTHVWRWANEGVSRQKDSSPKQSQSSQSVLLPVWASREPARGKPTTDWVAPSKFGSKETGNFEEHLSPLTTIAASRFLRGNLIHKLLQYLPTVKPGQRQKVAQKYLTNHGNGFSPQEHVEILAEIQAILTDKRFADVFAPGSLAEAPIVARIKTRSGQAVMVNGQIDRLVIQDHKILIVDYKTNKPPPVTLRNVNPQYIRQMAAYRLALREIYPNHTIYAGLLWTHNAVLMEIEESLLIEVFEQ